MGYSIISFIIVLGVLIFFHEFGHFLLARFFNVGVETFSIGFGPKIYKKKLGLTQYCLSIIPLGGYVKMIGENPDTVIAEQDISRSFSHKKPYEKILIVAAGPVFNFLLAILIFYFIFQFSGLYLIKPIVGGVDKNSPAFIAGIKKNDHIKKINGINIHSWENMVEIIKNSKGRDVKILLERKNKIFSVIIKPGTKMTKNIFGENIKRYIIGISATGESFHKSLNPFQALSQGLKQTWYIIKLTILSVIKMVDGSISAKNLGGPIMIAQMAGEQVKAGITSLAFFIAMLSINLGIINLFPIPVLDGGHILFFGIEAVTGKVISDKVKEKSNQIGITLLIILMAFVFYNDIVRLFSGS